MDYYGVITGDTRISDYSSYAKAPGSVIAGYVSGHAWFFVSSIITKFNRYHTAIAISGDCYRVGAVSKIC